jgi:putative transposase
MRYPDGGGLTAQARAKREKVRLQAAEMFAQGRTPPQAARQLRVSPKSAYAWRHAWKSGGTAALTSKGPGGTPPKLTTEQQARLDKELQAGPAAHGWVEDQRWTLARVAKLIKRLFGVSYSLKGVSLLLHRMGYSVQVPAHRAAERDEEAITTWRKETWPQVKTRRGGWVRGSSSPTSPASR